MRRCTRDVKGLLRLREGSLYTVRQEYLVCTFPYDKATFYATVAKRKLIGQTAVCMGAQEELMIT